MPITKRWAITQNLKQANDYATDENKCLIVDKIWKRFFNIQLTETKTKNKNGDDIDVTIKSMNNRLVSGINCNPNHVVEEMERVQQHLWYG